MGDGGGAAPQAGRAGGLRVRHAPAASARFAFFPSMGEYPAYDDAVYDAFDTPDVRHRAYRDAVAQAAPGRIVLDIGTGRDALWAIEAAKAGARHVYAIEAHPGFAQAAVAAVHRAGLSDQVTVLPGLSTEQTLPVRAEVCVSEIVGNVASAEGMIPVLADARDRLCTPDCAWIPFRAQTWAAAIDLPAAVFATEALPYLDAVFAAAGGPFDVRLCLAGPAHELLVSEPALVESLIFDSRRPSPPPSATTTVDLGRAGAGLLLWTRVAVTSHGREIDALSGESRGWAPIYLPLPPRSSTTVTFARRPGDDGIHPDYEVTVDGRHTVRSLHHGGGFRRTDLHRWLFDTPDPLRVS